MTFNDENRRIITYLYEYFRITRIYRLFYSWKYIDEVIQMTTIQDVLRLLGIGKRFVGYAIVAKAVPLAVEDETRLYCVSRCLYPLVAEQVPCSLSTMERNIRTVIEEAWKNNRQCLIRLAGYEMSQPPSVKQFLDILVTYILHAQGKKPA